MLSIMHKIIDSLHKHFKTLLPIIGVAGLTDLIREFVRLKLMEWIYSNLGSAGQWLRNYPVGVFTLGLILALFVLAVFVLLEAFSKPDASAIVDLNQRPFLIRPMVTKRWAIGFASFLRYPSHSQLIREMM